ncbi:MAG: FIST signal transduction protein [Candidatus Bathyarchaeia archaeon]|jgi:hypothetical protein
MVAQTAYSTKENLKETVEEIQKQFISITPYTILFFASSKYDIDQLGKELQKAYVKAKVFGCSTAGEIVTGKMLKNSVVAMAFDKDSIADIDIAVVEHVKKENNVKTALSQFEKYYKKALGSLSIDEYVGIILVDGLSGSEEKLMDTLGNLTDIIFIGGSAGDDLKFKATHVFANGKAYTDAAVLALLKPTKGYEILKTQSFKVLDAKLVATKVNEANREVVSFNKMPAVEAYAKATKTTSKTVADSFMKNPVGLVINNEPYVRSPQQVKESSMIFYCNIKEGAELSLLESTDIVNDTDKALKEIIKECNVTAVINFNCILRTLELEQKNQVEAYGKIFTNVPTVGFSTYGEEYLGHINQTATMLIIK